MAGIRAGRGPQRVRHVERGRCRRACDTGGARRADGQVSPTQFHNSVHNAAAGYWSIATGSQQAAHLPGCHDVTAAAALLKAMAEVHTRAAVRCCCASTIADAGAAAARRPTEGVFGAGFVLVAGRWPERAGACWRCAMRVTQRRSRQAIRPHRAALRDAGARQSRRAYAAAAARRWRAARRCFSMPLAGRAG